ncbi:hypothetical protein EVAR_28460_1 [Eumeta japonica]|uniref:Uncharacterized protein n=1 Tax=Eumeta variegata TaxID=151549 RepID=A0A4C1VBK8_EUMVA|nr:hypothetical protein EVAR_28460_1 [Eumeta japonica]
MFFPDCRERDYDRYRDIIRRRARAARVKSKARKVGTTVVGPTKLAYLMPPADPDERALPTLARQSANEPRNDNLIAVKMNILIFM